MVKIDLSSHHKPTDVNEPKTELKVSPADGLRTAVEARRFMMAERRRRARRSASDRPGQGRRKGEASYRAPEAKSAFEVVRDAAPTEGPDQLVDWDA